MKSATHTNHGAETMTLTADTITDTQINLLRAEAAEAGDEVMVIYCARALAGHLDALEVCAEVLNDAAAQADEECDR